MKRFFCSAATLLFLFAAGCWREEFALRTGDLLFQVGHGEMTDAIAAATGEQYTHVAIAVVEPDGVYALEASGERGVVMTPIAEFLAASALRDGKPVVAVGRLRSPGIEDRAVARAKTFLGQPYDPSFLPANGKMYCSELVWESYRDENGSLFAARPMNFRASDGTMPAYWTEHFAALGEPVPEGVLGTNPADMARDPAIRIVKTMNN